MGIWTTKTNHVDTIDADHVNKLQKHIPWYVPEDYGAVGDGVTDDTTAIQAAITAASNDTGGMVVLGDKTYVAGDLALYSHVHLVGMSHASVLKQINTSTYLASVNAGTGGTTDPAANIHDIVVANLQLLGTSSTDGFSEHVHLLNLNAASDILVDNCQFVGPRGDALHIGSSNVAGTERHNERITIRKCHFDGDGRENRNGITVADCTGLLIEDNYFTDISKSTMPGPIDIEPDDYVYTRLRDITIRKNRFYSYGGNIGAISVVLPNANRAASLTVPIQHITIEDNTIDTAVNAASNGIILYVSGGAAAATDWDHFFTVRNNRVTGTGANGWAISTGNVKGAVIEDNYIHNTLRGLLVNHLGTYDSYDVTIKGNTFYQVGGADEACAIHVFEVTRLAIDGNAFIDCGQVGLATGQAILFNGSAEYPATSDYVSITNNRFIAGTRMLYHALVAANHTTTPATNRWTGNTFASTIVGTFDAYLNDNVTDPTASYDSTVLPQSFPLGRSISVSNTSDTGLPGTYYQGLLITERYYYDTNYTKWIIQFYYPANEEAVSLSEIYFRKGVIGNTWSAWQTMLNVDQPLTTTSGPTFDHLHLTTGPITIAGTQVVGAQTTAVADATNSTDVVTRLNELLVRCRMHGLLAS